MQRGHCRKLYVSRDIPEIL